MDGVVGRTVDQSQEWDLLSDKTPPRSPRQQTDDQVRLYHDMLHVADVLAAYKVQLARYEAKEREEERLREKMRVAQQEAEEQQRLLTMQSNLQKEREELKRRQEEEMRMLEIKQQKMLESQNSQNAPHAQYDNKNMSRSAMNQQVLNASALQSLQHENVNFDMALQSYSYNGKNDINSSSSNRGNKSKHSSKQDSSSIRDTNEIQSRQAAAAHYALQQRQTLLDVIANANKDDPSYVRPQDVHQGAGGSSYPDPPYYTQYEDKGLVSSQEKSNSLYNSAASLNNAKNQLHTSSQQTYDQSTVTGGERSQPDTRNTSNVTPASMANSATGTPRMMQNNTLFHQNKNGSQLITEFGAVDISGSGASYDQYSQNNNLNYNNYQNNLNLSNGGNKRTQKLPKKDYSMSDANGGFTSNGTRSTCASSEDEIAKESFLGRMLGSFQRTSQKITKASKGVGQQSARVHVDAS